MPDLSRSRRKRQRLRKRLFVGGALLVAIFAVFFVMNRANDLMHRMKVQEVVSGGEVDVTAVKTEWNLDHDQMTATIYLANTSGTGVYGRLVFEFTMRSDRLAKSYLETYFRGMRPEQKVAFADEIRRMTHATPRNRAMLNYLENGEKTTFPEYEPMTAEGQDLMAELVFKKRSYKVLLPGGELTRAVVVQDLPANRMGDHVTAADVKLIGIQFE